MSTKADTRLAALNEAMGRLLASFADLSYAAQATLTRLSGALPQRQRRPEPCSVCGYRRKSDD